MIRRSLDLATARCLRPLILGIASCAAAMLPVASAAADEGPQYNRDIRPILAENCFTCHGADSAARKADLRLDVRDAAIDLGAITVGKPGDSELMARILSDDPELTMPPAETKKKLTALEKETLKRWISAGAKYERNWSFIAPRRAPLPSVKKQAWVKNAIDRFVLARLEQNGLAPAAEVAPPQLFRRLHLDITGLPPSPQDTAAFVADYRARRDQALAAWIDKLMKSTAWGEHRARYWLDAARYGDTHGLHFDNYREMWPYRDWVIRAFNSNQRFDQFTIEQLAGDLLPKPTDSQLIATGFQRCNMTTNEGGTIDEENLAIYAADRVQTLGWVYLGLTTNCGQCHDHKFDPFTTKDYYSMAAFFRNTTQPAKDGNVKDGRSAVVMVPSGADRHRWQALGGEIAAATAKRDGHRKSARPDFEKWLITAGSKAGSQKTSSEGLVAHLPLNDGSGRQVANLAGKPSRFPATGKLNWTDAGKFGPAAIMKRGGTINLGRLGDFAKTQKFSFAAWIKAARKNGFGGIIARMDEKAKHRGWDLYQNGPELAVHLIDSWPDNGLKVTTSGNVVRTGKWQHVFVTYDGSSKPDGVKIFIDGKPAQTRVEKNTLKPGATIRTKTPLRIGQRSDKQIFAGGSVQDFRLYKRMLNATEIKHIAGSAPLQAILAVAAEKRTPEQKKALFSHYLVTQDKHYSDLSEALTKLESEREAIKKRSPLTHVQREKEKSMPAGFILMRGAYDKPGEKVTAATPAAFPPLPDKAPHNRLGLAKWIVDPSNPLTARVTVNRFWQQVFGQGIVTTAEDFGVMGAAPSHPQLLDWLAVEFRESGWDVQRLFKLMLMSATYRQAAITTPEKLAKDRHNALLSRGPRFRMDAEMVRDYALAVSGLMSAKMYGPGVRPYQPENIWDIVGLPGGDTRNYVQDKGENLYRRSLYSFWKRMAPPTNLEAFNAPSREVCTVRRERTNTPLQALVTLNDPQFVEAARHLAQRALAAGQGDENKIVDFIARCVLCRPLKSRERSILLAGKKELLAYYGSKPADAKALIAFGDSKSDQKLDAVQLACWTMVCNQVMNLDEVLNK